MTNSKPVTKPRLIKPAEKPANVPLNEASAILLAQLRQRHAEEVQAFAGVAFRVDAARLSPDRKWVLDLERGEFTPHD